MKSKRLLLALSLVVVLLALGLYSQLTYKQHRQYPTVQDVISHYSSYVGQKVPVWGEVVSSDNNSIMIVTITEGKEVFFTLLSDAEVAQGDEIEAFGTLDENFTFVPDQLIAHKKWKNDLILVRSAVAIPLILFVFFKAWRFDRKTKRFVEKA